MKTQSDGVEEMDGEEVTDRKEADKEDNGEVKVRDGRLVMNTGKKHCLS